MKEPIPTHISLNAGHLRGTGGDVVEYLNPSSESSACLYGLDLDTLLFVWHEPGHSLVLHIKATSDAEEHIKRLFRETVLTVLMPICRMSPIVAGRTFEVPEGASLLKKLFYSG